VNKENDIFLSIVIPVYNVMDYIGECIDSIINQKIDIVEIIVVNDGSTDGCDIFLDNKYSDSHQVKLINQINGGISSARNAGIDVANGKYIAVLDGDDRLKEGCLLKAISCLKKNNPDILMMDYIKEWIDGGRYYNNTGSNLITNKVLDVFDDSVLSSVYDGSELYAWRFIVKSDIYKKTLFEEGYVFEDIRNIPLLITKATTFFYLPLVFVIYNQRPGSTMKTKSIKNIMDLSSSTIPLKAKAGNLRLSNSSMISHDTFSMKVFVWSIQDLIISKSQEDVTNKIKENLRKSLFNNGIAPITKLKVMDKKMYILYSLLSKNFILKSVFFILKKSPKSFVFFRFLYRFL